MKEWMKSIIGRLSQTTPELSFEVRFWDGETHRYGSGTPSFNLTCKTKNAAKHVFTRGPLGFGEEYLKGNVSVDGSFQQLLRLGLDPSFQNSKLPILSRLQALWRKARSLNTPKQAAGNIAHHYDRGNEFFALWLDETMTYSCAYFRSGSDTLGQAQQQKYEHVCRKLLLKRGDTLLDIGCGWGGMLFYAAKNYGNKGVGCTLSRQQYEYAVEKIKREGLGGTVSVLLADYRSLSGQFDKLASIGMFEHVGKRYIPTFMKKVKSLLKPGGIGLLHTIGKERETPGNPWTLTYIFPGGYIPTLHEILHGMGEAGLQSVDMENLRLHYAKTLDEWSRRFEMNVERIQSLFDESFVRMWRMFLNGSAVGFRYGDSRLYQITFTNGINNDLPITRDHIYFHDSMGIL
ncbi:MAG: class I SAM-dependent methyltransferase [Bacteroidota bacterium]